MSATKSCLGHTDKVDHGSITKERMQVNIVLFIVLFEYAINSERLNNKKKLLKLFSF